MLHFYHLISMHNCTFPFVCATSTEQARNSLIQMFSEHTEHIQNIVSDFRFTQGSFSYKFNITVLLIEVLITDLLRHTPSNAVTTQELLFSRSVDDCRPACVLNSFLPFEKKFCFNHSTEKCQHHIYVFIITLYRY